jgi:hypothetical protein
MKNGRWFSTKLRFAIMVEPVGADTLNDCVFMLRAADFDEAFQRAVSVGHASEKKYRNLEGQLVQWVFSEIVSLDVIQSEDLDGKEVYSEPIHLSNERAIPFKTAFNPAASKPLQTI